MKAVIILSGGMDSTTLAYEVVNGINGQHFDEVHAISFDYGQRHVKELKCAKVTAKKLGLVHHIVDVSGLSEILKSALTGDCDVPEGAYDDDNQKLTVVPNRNMIMLSIAAGYAMSIKAMYLYYGAHAGDHAIYPDCRPEFVDAMNTVLSVADYNYVELVVPYLHYTKGMIAKRGKLLGVPYEDTWTCYKGGEKPCGVCGSCDERLAAFKEAGMIDPLEYEIPMKSQVDDLADFILDNFDEEIVDGGAVNVAKASMIHWRNVAFDLWRLLDNIDTLTDACKDNNEEFRKQAIIQTGKRHGVLFLDGRTGKRYEQYLKEAYE